MLKLMPLPIFHAMVGLKRAQKSEPAQVDPVEGIREAQLYILTYHHYSVAKGTSDAEMIVGSCYV